MLPINLLDFSAPAATLTYKRANPPGKPGNVAGKWWTTERNHLFALDLKVDGKNKVSGSINVCGIVPREIASGEVVDRRVTFQVPWPTGTPGGPAPGGVPRGRGVRNLTVWSGDLVAPDTLTLASPPGFACINDRPRTIVLARSR
jgi:hypothetical protein